MSKISKIFTVSKNVGNIRFNSNNSWIGQIGEYKGFVCFIDQIYSIRALIILIKNYINKYDDCSIERIISRYAPSTENDTLAYIKFVQNAFDEIGYSYDHIISNFDLSMYTLCRSICQYETGFILTLNEFNYVRQRFNV